MENLYMFLFVFFLVSLFIFLVYETIITLSEGFLLGSCIPWEFIRFNPRNLRINENGIMWLSQNVSVPSVSKHSSLLSKYTICNYGRVARWSSLHRTLNNYYELARRNTIEISDPIATAASGMTRYYTEVSGSTLNYLHKKRFKFGK